MGEATLRPFLTADLPDLLDLWVASWQVTFPAIDFASRRVWFAGYLGDLHTAGAATHCAVETSAGLVGFATIDPERCCLEQLAVRPDRFGSPVGTMLMDEAKRVCPEHLSLTVNQDNRRALRFYERCGFQIIRSGVTALSGMKTWDMLWEPDPTGFRREASPRS